MQYKTIIEIINEAENPTEAADIAGEYLRSSIDAGVWMKCTTKPLRNYRTPFIILCSLLIISFIGLTSFKANKDNPSPSISTFRNVSAIQPPLKTHFSEDDLTDILEEKTR